MANSNYSPSPIALAMITTFAIQTEHMKKQIGAIIGDINDEQASYVITDVLVSSVLGKPFYLLTNVDDEEDFFISDPDKDLI